MYIHLYACNSHCNNHQKNTPSILSGSEHVYIQFDRWSVLKIVKYHTSKGLFSSTISIYRSVVSQQNMKGRDEPSGFSHTSGPQKRPGAGRFNVGACAYKSTYCSQLYHHSSGINYQHHGGTFVFKMATSFPGQFPAVSVSKDSTSLPYVWTNISQARND